MQRITTSMAGGCNPQDDLVPDGTIIAFSLSHGFGTPRSLEVINIDGAEPTPLLTNVRQNPGGADLEPDGAPDGSRIAYVLFTGNTGRPGNPCHDRCNRSRENH